MIEVKMCVEKIYSFLERLLLAKKLKLSIEIFYRINLNILNRLADSILMGLVFACS